MGAMFRAVEGAEDSPELAAKDLQSIGLDERDCVVGIAASGCTPYVLGSIEEAKKFGAFTGAISCCKNSRIGLAADFAVEVETGPEVLMGSTRLRAGTATKLVLNTLTTGAMILLGKTMGDLMVDFNPSNEKLRLRAVRIVALAADVSTDSASDALKTTDGQVKTAIVCLRSKLQPEAARDILTANGGRVNLALAAISS
jgi:N-acetylmuramic acid 6-phosphate etherase